MRPIRALAFGVLALAAATFLTTGAISAQDGLFRRLAGTWSGAGTVSLLGGGPERLRCRASYTPSGEARLHLAIACASDSFKMQVTSDVGREGDRVSGTWREDTFGINGQVSGTVSGDRVDATVAGLGITARLTIALRGRSQSVTLSSQGQLAGTASVTLRRN